MKQTVNSVCDSGAESPEILIVDDGSTTEPCETLASLCTVLRHTERHGVAVSRDDAIRCAKGTAFAILDGHQQLSVGCLPQCAELAEQYQAIVVPDLCDFADSAHIHGAYFDSQKQSPPFGAKWRMLKPKALVTRINSLKAPAYVIPAEIYPKVRWSRLLRGWGGSEGSVSLKAFFTDTPILHLCGPIAYHKFKKTFHYEVTWDEIWRNHALIARICFSEATWYDYWLPEVFREHLNEETQQEMDSDAVKAEHLEFQQIKVRPDHEFWTRLAFQKVPLAIKR